MNTAEHIQYFQAEYVTDAKDKPSLTLRHLF